jgi:hypothetical protein
MNYVYVIGNLELNYFKIGVSCAPASRLKQLDTPFELQVLHAEPCGTVREAPAVERAVHMLFHRQRVRGEWFHCLDLVDAIAQIKALGSKR